MALDADNSKGHPCHIAKGVAREYSCRVPEESLRRGKQVEIIAHKPVVVHKACADGNEGKHEIQTEEVSLDEFLTAVCHACTPDATYLNFRLVSHEMKRDVESYWPWEVEEVVEND